MTIGVNAKQLDKTLRHHLEKDASILKDVGNVLSFAAVALAGGPLTLLAALGYVAKTAGSVMSSVGRITDMLSSQENANFVRPLSSHERLRLLFYLYAQRAYIQSLQSHLESPETSALAGVTQGLTPDAFARFRAALEPTVDSVKEGEVVYSFCIDPTDKTIPLFEAYGSWLTETLHLYGADVYQAKELANKVEENARQQLRSMLSADTPDAGRLRNFIVLNHLDDMPKLRTDLENIRITLESWTDETAADEREEEAWNRYRSMLQSLPDDKETMYNESFGVREVFVMPQATYQMIAENADVSPPELVPDMGELLAGLVSNRAPSGDLIILCGGPGSGKSTLCRMLASELAQYPSMHPVFLRLRRCDETMDICNFVEHHLRNEGIIERLSELHDVANLVLILDAFDELAMASRHRLGIFFNYLQEDLRTSALRNAKVIVSGRDTLFPDGKGLPLGSHLVRLVPFDKGRVERWGQKWRGRFTDEKDLSRSFHPEAFFESGDKAKESALHHVVTWPLTLHLVAQVHRAGHLDTSEKAKRTIKKAYLYRTILVQTIDRQARKAPEQGRLSAKAIRAFLQALAWEMYIRSVESLGLDKAKSIIERFFPNATPEQLDALGDLNILNAPAIQKNEDKDFEFIHKSFSEYLVAEKLASHLEGIAYTVPDRLTKKEVYKLSDNDVRNELVAILGIRLLPEEVQEMLESMVGCWDLFIKGTSVHDIVPPVDQLVGLEKLKKRFESIYCDMLTRPAQLDINDAPGKRLLGNNPLEAYANCAAGVAMIGTTAARQQNSVATEVRSSYFQGNPFRGAFWRFLWILHAGGVTIDEPTAYRIFSGMTIVNEAAEKSVGDFSIPLSLSALRHVHGYSGRLLGDVIAMLKGVQEMYISGIAYTLTAFLRSQMKDKDIGYFSMCDYPTVHTVRSICLDGLVDDLRVARFIPSRSDDLDWAINSLIGAEKDACELLHYMATRQPLTRQAVIDTISRLGRLMPTPEHSTEMGSHSWLSVWLRTQCHTSGKNPP